MASNPSPPPKKPDTTDLAVLRTRLAQERTLMAWIRTGFSMISFGFTLIKTFQYLKDSKTLDPGRPMLQPRNLGATLIVLGTVSLIAASWQHWRLLRQMSGEGHPQFSLALVIALILTLVGILAFIGAFTRSAFI